MLAMVLALAVTQVPATAAAPLRYRLETRTTSDQDLTSMGRGKLNGSLTTTAIITVTLTDSAEGQIARVTVDSLRLEPTGEMTRSLPPATALAIADTARGAYVRAYTVRGRVRGSPQASIASPALASILQAMNVLFPGLRSNLKVGDSWADTTAINNDVQGGHQSGSVIATWKVDSMINGAFVLNGASATHATTSGQTGQTLMVTGSSQEQLITGGHGPTRSATIESVNDATLTVPQNKSPIPSRSVGSLKLIPLP